MKILISFKFLLLLCFFSFTLPETEESCPSVEEAPPVSSMIKICDFGSFVNSANTCSSTTFELEIGNDCIGQAAATIQAVNIVSNPTIGSEYSLPTGVDDLYYSYTPLGGTEERIGPINKFKFMGDYETTSGSSLPIFVFTEKMYFDLSEDCTNSTTGDASIAVQVRLEDISGNLYLIDNHADVGEVFYCQVFDETCDACANPLPSCGGGQDPVYYAQFCGSCSSSAGTCGAAGPKSSVSENTELSEQVSLTVQPNPFSDFLMLIYTANQEASAELEILDAKGSVVQSEMFNTIIGENRFRVDTDALPKGIYFCRLKVGEEVLTEKLIKNN